jgi:hypothetical protein
VAAQASLPFLKISGGPAQAAQACVDIRQTPL